MAATLQQRAQQRGLASCSRPPAASRTAVRVSCQRVEQSQPLYKAQLAAAAFAAATLLSTSAADAGVVLQKKELKKVFFDDSPPAVPAPKKALASLQGKNSVSAPSPKAKASSGGSTSEGGIDPKVVALPGALVAVGGGAFALLKLDSGFESFMEEALVKNSNNYAGYEQAIKTGNGVSFKAGTRKMKGGTGKGTKGTGKSKSK